MFPQCTLELLASGALQLELAGYVRPKDLRSRSAAHTQTHTFLRARALSQVLEPNKVPVLQKAFLWT